MQVEPVFVFFIFFHLQKQNDQGFSTSVLKFRVIYAESCTEEVVLFYSECTEGGRWRQRKAFNHVTTQ